MSPWLRHGHSIILVWLHTTLDRTLLRTLTVTTLETNPPKRCVHFGIESVEKLVAIRKVALLTDMVKQTIIISRLCQTLCWFVSFVSRCIFYCVCLISVCCINSFIFCYHVRRWNKAVYEVSQLVTGQAQLPVAVCPRWPALRSPARALLLVICSNHSPKMPRFWSRDMGQTDRRMDRPITASTIASLWAGHYMPYWINDLAALFCEKVCHHCICTVSQKPRHQTYAHNFTKY